MDGGGHGHNRMGQTTASSQRGPWYLIPTFGFVILLSDLATFSPPLSLVVGTFQVIWS